MPWLVRSRCSTTCKLCVHNPLMLLLMGVGSCSIPGGVCPRSDSSRFECWIAVRAVLTVLAVGKVCSVPPCRDPCLLPHLPEGGSCLAFGADPRDLCRADRNEITYDMCTASVRMSQCAFCNHLHFLKKYIMLIKDMATPELSEGMNIKNGPTNARTCLEIPKYGSVHVLVVTPEIPRHTF